jgi:hypothetical protein
MYYVYIKHPIEESDAPPVQTKLLKVTLYDPNQLVYESHHILDQESASSNFREDFLVCIISFFVHLICFHSNLFEDSSKSKTDETQDSDDNDQDFDEGINPKRFNAAQKSSSLGKFYNLECSLKV